MTRSIGYQVRLRVDGQLDPRWSVLLAGLEVTVRPDGSTLLRGELPDQAALHGLLATVRDLGLPLISFATVAVRRTAAIGGS